MKYLYMIFRLFKCKHKYVSHLNSDILNQKKIIGYVFIRRCSKCGVLKTCKVNIK